VVTVPDGAPGRAESSLPETLPGQVAAMTTIATNAAPGRVQSVRGSQGILRFLIMASLCDVGDSMSD
jgi:hypothetical protein